MRAVGFDTGSVADYRKFLRLRTLPTYQWRGTTAFVPDEYAGLLDCGDAASVSVTANPIDGLFDYQRDIVSLAVRKQKFAVFADCGLGKTLIILEFARHAHEANGDGNVLIVSPLMVVSQTVEEALRWYGDAMEIDVVTAAELGEWLESGGNRIGITNYEAIRDGLPHGRLKGLVLDESSMLKSHYGKWGKRLIRMGRGVPFKLCATGTPAASAQT